MQGHYYENAYVTSFQILSNSSFINHHKIQVHKSPIATDCRLQVSSQTSNSSSDGHMHRILWNPAFHLTAFRNFEPSESLQLLPFYFLKLLLILSYQIRIVLSCGLFPPGFPTKTYDYSSTPNVPHALPIPSSLN